MTRRKIRRGALALTATAVLAGAVFTAAPGHADDGDVSVTGTIEVVYADNFSAHKGNVTYTLHAPGRRALAVEPDDAATADLVTGQRVRVTGEVEGAAITGAEVTPLAAAATAAAAKVRTVAVLLAYGADGGPTFPPGYKQGAEQELPDVDLYYRESSDNQVGFDFHVQEPIAIPKDNGCNNFDAWWNAANSAAKAQGINVDAFDHVLVAMPPRSCGGWAGTATIGSRRVVVNASVTNLGYVAAHELGHNLTLQHASTIRCKENRVNVPLGGSCTEDEYGDPFTVMGNGARTIHARHAAQLSWITQQTVTQPGQYHLARMHSGGSPQAISVRVGSSVTYDLEIRKALLPAFDTFAESNAAVKGVTIRLWEGGNGYTKLIDNTPQTPEFTDAALPVGQTFTSGKHNFSVRVDSVDATGADVTIAFGPIPPSGATTTTTTTTTTATTTTTTPSAPNAGAPTTPTNLAANVNSRGRVSLSWTKSTDDGQVQRYELFRNGGFVQKNRRASMVDSPGKGTFTYTVVAVDGDGNRSAPSAPLQVTVT